MSFTYSGNPSSSERDRYRFLLGDTNSAAPIMTDAEMDYIVDTSEGNENKALYLLFSRAAVLFARDIKRSLGPQSEDPTHRMKFFQDKAAEYKALMVNAGIGQVRNAYPKIFRKGMQSNPRWPQPSKTMGVDDYFV